MAEDKRKKDERDEGISWAVIIAMFILQLWPIGLLLLVLKLHKDENREKKLTERERQAIQQASRKYTPVDRPVIDLEPTEEPKRPEKKPAKKEKHSPTKKAAKTITKTPRTSGRGAKLLKLLGAVLLVVGGLQLYQALDDLVWGGPDRYSLWYLGQSAAWLLAGGVALFSGFRMAGRLRRNERYLALLSQKSVTDFEQLGRMIGLSRKQVARDLRDMWERGDLPEGAFLNLEQGRYYASVQAAEEAAAAKRAAENAPPRQTEEGWSGMLRAIRRLNDAIADPALSARVDRIAELGGRILRVVEEEPEKEPQVRGFLDYYLPTTKKLLEAYVSFEATGLDTGRLAEAQERIAAAMAQLEQGYEHQLEALYQADTMDIETEIRVLETMLRRDIGSTEDDFNL